MSTLTQGAGTGRRLPVVSTRVSRYEKVSALLLAVAVFLGAIGLVLFLIFLTTIVRIAPTQAVVEFNDELAGNNDNPEGIAEDFLEPGVEELADVPEPQLADAIEAMTDAVSTQAAHLEQVEGNMPEMGSGRGLGDRRQAGPGSGGDRTDRPWERWEIRYSTASREEYAAQLDFFGIELGALDRETPTIHYVGQLSRATPARRSDTRSRERRIYFNCRQGRLVEWDREFFVNGGLDLGEGNSRYFPVQFYANETQNILVNLETQAKNPNRSIDDIRRTVFGVRAGGNGFEYYVIEIQYKF